MLSGLAPELILYNGVIATQDYARPRAQALALGQGAILAVGTDQEVKNLAGPGVKLIDLNGRMVTPGFIDSHIHFYEWALKRQGVRLDDLTSLEEMLSRVGLVAGEQPSGNWIMGQGWNETEWDKPLAPTRQWLDQAAPQNPVLFWRCDLHLAVANSMALDLAGINAQTPDPPEGRIERGPDGEPTGVLRELAINLVRRVVSPPDASQTTEAFESAARALHGLGITGIQDTRLMKDEDGASAFGAFQSLDQDGRLGLRTWMSLPGHHLDQIIGLGLRSGFGNDRLRLGHVKFFSDGGMGARTAWMIDPYLDAERGMPLIAMDELAREIARADQAGLAVMVHAVGDRANRELVNIFQNLESQRTSQDSPRPALPHRMEHLQMIRPEDVAKLAGLNLALCVTPANLLLDINLIDSAIGEKGKYTYAFRPLMDTGSPVVFSSDCPVCDPDPLIGIRAAVTRQRDDATPEGGWHPKNRVSISEAIKAYTATPAVIHRTADLGVIAPGKKADLAVLSGDLLEADPERLAEIAVDMTFFDGQMVYQRA